MDGKVSGKRPDALFLYGGFELGAIKRAKSNRRTGNEHLYNSHLKLRIIENPACYVCKVK